MKVTWNERRVLTGCWKRFSFSPLVDGLKIRGLQKRLSAVVEELNPHLYCTILLRHPRRVRINGVLISFWKAKASL